MILNQPQSIILADYEKVYVGNIVESIIGKLITLKMTNEEREHIFQSFTNEFSTSPQGFIFIPTGIQCKFICIIIGSIYLVGQ